jgi:hypothetical protein
MTAELLLELCRGRTSPGDALDGWGSDGPVFRITWLHVTYLATLRFGLPGVDTEAELPTVGEFVVYDRVLYGDWTVHSIDELARCPDLKSRITPFEREKATESDRPVQINNSSEGELPCQTC